MDDLVPILVMGLIGYFTLALVRLVMENRLRHTLIEKGMVDEKVKLLYQVHPVSDSQSSLKWGMVAIGVGLAFLIGQLPWIPAAVREEITAGSVFLLAGVGLILYYFIARRNGAGPVE